MPCRFRFQTGDMKQAACQTLMTTGRMVLMLCVGAGAVACRREPKASSSAAAVQSGAFVLKQVTVERDGAHLHLTLTVQTAEAPAESAPAVTLLTETGTAVLPFIAPGLAGPVFAAGTDASTHWWVSGDALSGALDLKIGSASLRVKNAGAFDLNALPAGQPVVLPFPAWRVPAAP